MTSVSTLNGAPGIAVNACGRLRTKRGTQLFPGVDVELIYRIKIKGIRRVEYFSIVGPNLLLGGSPTLTI